MCSTWIHPFLSAFHSHSLARSHCHCHARTLSFFSLFFFFPFQLLAFFTRVLFVSVPPLMPITLLLPPLTFAQLCLLCAFFSSSMCLCFIYFNPLDFLLPASTLISQSLYLSLEMSDKLYLTVELKIKSGFNLTFFFTRISSPTIEIVVIFYKLISRSVFTTKANINLFSVAKQSDIMVLLLLL